MEDFDIGPESNGSDNDMFSDLLGQEVVATGEDTNNVTSFDNLVFETFSQEQAYVNEKLNNPLESPIEFNAASTTHRIDFNTETEKKETEELKSDTNQAPAPILPTDTDEVKRKKEKLNQDWAEVLEQWEEDGQQGIDVLFPKVIQAQGQRDEEERKKEIERVEAEILDILQEKNSDFTDAEVSNIMDFTIENRARYHKILLHRLFLKALKVEGGKYYNQIFVIFMDPAIPVDEKIKKFRNIIAKAAKESGDQEFIDLVEQEERVARGIDVIDLVSGAQTSLTDLQQRIEEDTFGRIDEQDLTGLPVESLEPIAALVDRGDTDTALFVLNASNRTPLSNGVQVDVQDQQLRVVLEGSSVKMYLPGERQYTLMEDVDVESAFDIASTQKTGGDADLSVLDHRAHQLWVSKLSGVNLHDDTVSTIREREWVQTLFNSLLRGKITSSNEEAFLKDIKILTPGGDPSSRFTSWWSVQMRYLDAMGALQAEGGTLSPEGMIELAKRWEDENQFSFADPEQLQL